MCIRDRFNAIAGGFYVDDGAVLLDGEDITFLPEYKPVSYTHLVFHSVYAGVSAGAPEWTAYLEPVCGAGPDVCGSCRTAADGDVSHQGSIDIVKKETELYE